jgi:hypothetical protein
VDWLVLEAVVIESIELLHIHFGEFFIAYAHVGCGVDNVMPSLESGGSDIKFPERCTGAELTDRRRGEDEKEIQVGSKLELPCLD